MLRTCSVFTTHNGDARHDLVESTAFDTNKSKIRGAAIMVEHDGSDHEYVGQKISQQFSPRKGANYPYRHS